MAGAARPVAQEDADCRPHSDRQLAVPGLLDGAGGGMPANEQSRFKSTRKSICSG